MEAFQLFEMLLDLLDAGVTAAAMVSFWYVWIRPPPTGNDEAAKRRSKGRLDVDLFICRAREVAAAGIHKL